MAAKIVPVQGLAALRSSLGLTQAAIAKRAGVAQSEVSRVELRGDCLVSTLKRYVKSIGGELELVVSVKGREYPVTLTKSAKRAP